VGGGIGNLIDEVYLNDKK